MNNEDLVLAYRNIRDAIQAREDKHKDELQILKGQLEALADKMLEICNEGGMDGFKTSAGTVSRTVQTRFWPADWEVMYKFVQDHEAPDLLEKRIHQTNMREFLGDNPEAVPEGLQTDRKYVIKVRKPPPIK